MKVEKLEDLLALPVGTIVRIDNYVVKEFVVTGKSWGDLFIEYEFGGKKMTCVSGFAQSRNIVPQDDGCSLTYFGLGGTVKDMRLHIL